MQIRTEHTDAEDSVELPSEHEDRGYTTFHAPPKRGKFAKQWHSYLRIDSNDLYMFSYPAVAQLPVRMEFRLINTRIQIG